MKEVRKNQFNFPQTSDNETFSSVFRNSEEYNFENRKINMESLPFNCQFGEFELFDHCFSDITKVCIIYCNSFT